MKLPNANRAIVNREKITEYLLCSAHPDGYSKSVFFAQFGFTLERWKIFAESLCNHGATHKVAKVVESAYGTRYSIDGSIKTPDGRNPKVRTVWIIEKHAVIPRLITAYPK